MVENALALVGVLHVMHQGESKDIPLNQANIGLASPDNDIKQAVALWLDVSPEDFRKMVVERHENGNMTLRPEAIFG